MCASVADAFEVRDSSTASRLRAASGDLYVPPTNLSTVCDIYNRMRCGVRLAGQGPFPFVVDTGANQSVVSAELAQKIGLPFNPPALLNGVAGALMAPTTFAVLDIGGKRKADAAFSILPAAAIGGNGLLGLDHLGGQRLILDFKNEALRIAASSRFFGSTDDVVIKASRVSGQLTLVDADVAGIHITAFIDSGAQSTIGNMALRTLAIARGATSAWYSTPILSATGQTIASEMASLPNLRIGGLKLPSWPVAFADLHTFRMWDLVDKPAILIGVDILSRFESVSLDFARNEVRFRLPNVDGAMVTRA